MGPNPLIGLISFVIMGIFTLWFTAFMLKAVDILYNPSVKKWIINSGQKVINNINTGKFEKDKL